MSVRPGKTMLEWYAGWNGEYHRKITSNISSRRLGRFGLCFGPFGSSWSILGVERSEQVFRRVHDGWWQCQPGSYRNVPRNYFLFRDYGFGYTSRILSIWDHVWLLLRHLPDLHHSKVHLYKLQLKAFFSAELFGPMYKDFGYTSTYEYMETRFHKSVRIMTTLIYVVQTIMYIGMAIYAPALALETVTGLGKWESVWLTGGVCIFYTSIGGLKAVVWTDTIQLFILLSGFFGVIIQGSVVFGFDDVIEKYHEGGRQIWNDFSFDPRVRHSFWSIVLGGLFGTWGNSWCSSQSMVQRVLACRTKKDIRISLYSAWFLICCIVLLCAMTGATLYRFNNCCDPLQAGWIESTDQLVPYLAVEQFQNFPGVAGLYISGAYCGCLSTVSSGINSMATVIVTDFVQPAEGFLTSCCNFVATERFYLWLGKILSVLLGLACIGFAYIASGMGGILQASLSINNIIGGAHFAVYVLAVLNPYANRWGAHFGFLIGLAFSTWIYIGSQDGNYPVPNQFSKKLNIEAVGCRNSTEAEYCNYPIEEVNDEMPEIYNLYWLSYMYLGTAGFTACFFIGSLISLLTGDCSSVSALSYFRRPKSTKIAEKCAFAGN